MFEGLAEPVVTTAVFLGEGLWFLEVTGLETTAGGAMTCSEVGVLVEWTAVTACVSLVFVRLLCCIGHGLRR